MVESVKTPTIERVAKLEVLGKGLEEVMSSLNREPPVIIYHPSRLPSRLEFNELFAISRGNAVEHDIRKGSDEGYSIQQGMFTDRLKVWNAMPINTIEGFRNVFGMKRASAIMELVKRRTGSENPTIEEVKGNLLVNYLKLKELQRLARLGGEEILSLGQFLDVYQGARRSVANPGRLSVDFKDGDVTISGGDPSLAISATEEFVKQMKRRGIGGDAVFMAIQYNVPALLASKKKFSPETKIVGAASSDIIKVHGEDPFAEYVRTLVENAGVEWISVKRAELDLIRNTVDPNIVKYRATGVVPQMMIYFPPAESKDIKLVLETLVRYPNIGAIQIDA